MELLLPESAGGALPLFIPSVISAILLLLMVIVAATPSTVLAPAVDSCVPPTTPSLVKPLFTRLRRRRSLPGSAFPSWFRRANCERQSTLDSVADARPRGVSESGGGNGGAGDSGRASGRVSLLGAYGAMSPGTPSATSSLESLRHALMWERHRYRAKLHVLRVHLTGRNTAMHPWRLPPLTPELRLLVSEGAYYRIAEHFARAADWRLWEIIYLSLLWVLLPPVAVRFLHARRKVHWRQARDVMLTMSNERSEGAGLWRSMYSRVSEAHRLELGCGHERAFGWLDIFVNVSNAPMQLSRGGALALQQGRMPPLPSAYMQPSLSGLSQPPMTEPPFNSPAASLSGSAPLPSASVDSTRGLGLGSGEYLQSDRIASEDAGAMGGAPPGLSVEPLVCAGAAGARMTAAAIEWSARSSFTSFAERSSFTSFADVTAASAAAASAGAPAALEPRLHPPFMHANPRGGYGAESGGGGSGSSGCLHYPEPPALGLLPLHEASVDAEGMASPYGAHRLAFRLVEPRVSHEVRVCGQGTFLSPFWVELTDFLVYDAFSTALDASAATVAACLNARLQSLCAQRRDWRSQLRRVVALIDAVNAQQVAGGAALTAAQAARRDSQSGAAREPPALALVRRPLTAEEEGLPCPLVVLIGTGDPGQWTLPAGAALLTPECLEPFAPRGSEGSAAPLSPPPHPLLVDCALRVLLGHWAPMPRPYLAAATLLLLLLTEALISALALSGLCQLPERATSCAATVLCLPFAGILSPLAGLLLLSRVASHLRGRHKGREHALSASSSGQVVRDLHVGALWNTTSLVNALVAQLCFVPLALYETVSTWRAVQLALIPLGLLTTKLLTAQAFKALAAAVGITADVWAMLQQYEAHAARKDAADEQAGGVVAEGGDAPEDNAPQPNHD